jgi:hypothetical protein
LASLSDPDTTLATNVASVRKSVLDILYAAKLSHLPDNLNSSTVVQLGLQDKVPFVHPEELANFDQLLASRSGFYIPNGNGDQDPVSPTADFCGTIEMNRFTLSHDSVTCRRPPEVSSTAFDAQPPDLPPVSLMDMGFAIICPLARHRRPPIRFLFIGSRLCSTLLSGPASRRVLFHPCASL